MAGRLVVLDRAGRAKCKSFLLPSGMCTLGRGAACDIRVLLPTVSPHHATVTVHANQTVVRNVGSGRTLVNGEPVSVCALRHGDELALGGRRLRWEYDAPAQPRRSKTEPALALPSGAGAGAGATRSGRRGTLPAAPRAPDRDVRLALELRHRNSMPASSGVGGKQVAIVQPQRRDATNQNDAVSSPRAAESPEPAPRKANSARLHTPTKATLWIESRRGRARAASLRTATPLRLAVLRKALTPAARARAAVTKIQAPLRVDQTKQAAIMLMTGHTPKCKLSPAGPAFAAKTRGPVVRAPSGSLAPDTPDTPDKAQHSTVTPENLVPETSDKSARRSNARQSSKRSVSVVEIGESRSPAPAGPRKSALKTTAGPRKTESIKFDLSNVDSRGSIATEDEDDVLVVTDGTRGPPSPSPRRAVHSRGSVAVRRALETSDGTFVTECSYSVVDLVSLDSPALLGCSTPLPRASRVSAAGRGRKRLDDSPTVDSVYDEESPKSSRKTPRKTPAKRDSGRLDESVPSESEDGSPKKSGTSILSTSNLSNLCVPSESRRSDVSFTSIRSGRTPGRGSRGYSVPDSSPDTSMKPRVTLSTSNRKTLEKTPSPTKPGSRGRLDVNVAESPKDFTPDKSGRPRSGASVRSLPVELSQSDVSLDSSAISQATARSTKSPKSVSPDKSRKSRTTLSASTRRTRSLPFESPRSEVSPNKSRKSRAMLTASNGSTLPLESSQSDVSLEISKKSPGKTVSPKRGSRSAPESPKVDESRMSRATLSTSNRRTRSLPFESPRSEILLDSTRKSKSMSKSQKDVSPDKPRMSRAISSRGRSTRSLVFESSQSDASLDSSRKSPGKTLSPQRSSRGKVVEGASGASPYKSKKSTASLSTSNRRTRSLSPNKSAASTRSGLGRGSGPASPGPGARLSRRSGKSPSASISSTPVASPTNVSSKSSRASRRTLDTSDDAPAGHVTPERGADVEEAGTPVLSIRTLLDASLGLPETPSPSHSPPRKRDKRNTFAFGRGATRAARGAIRSKSLIVAGRDGDVTPTGASEPSPEAVKHKHSSAKKSRSRRSIIDTLDDSGLVRHLFGSPVKRKLSRSMTEFSRRHLEEPEAPEPAPRARRSIRNDLTDVRGVKRAFARSPEDDLRRVSGVRDLFRERHPRDDLTDVRGVRELFVRRGPRNELVDVSGVKDGLKVRSPNNDLRDVRGVRRLYGRSWVPPSPDVSGVARLLDEAPPVRATYSETFVARSTRKPTKRRRTTSPGVPVDVLVNHPGDWLRAANKSVARALQQLATDTVAGTSPLTESRMRSAAESYAAHTLPLKKRSLARVSAPRSAKKRSLPLKKRALVHSTPVKGRASRAADETLARMSPIAMAGIALEPAPPESPPVVPASPKGKPTAEKRETEDVVEKNESVRPSPKKTRAKRAEEAAEGRRVTRGGKAASKAKTRTPKKNAAAERAATKAPSPKKSPTPKRAPATRRAAAAAGKPTVVARKPRAVAKPAARGVPKSAAASSSRKPGPERSAGDRSKPDSPSTSPAPGRKRAKRVDAAEDAPEPAKTRRARAAPSPAPRRKTRKAPPTPVPEKTGRKVLSTPGSKRARKIPPTPEPKRGRRQAPPPVEPKKTPEPKRGRRVAPTPEPKKGRRAPPTPQPKRGRKAAPTSEPTVAKATPEPKKGRNARREPKNASKTAPTPEPKRGRRAAAPAPEPQPKRGRKAPAVVAKKVHNTPEPAPEPKRGRKAAAPPQPAKRAPASEPGPPQRQRARAAAKGNKEAPKPKGKKVATPVVEESATRGRKRKNDTASVEKKSEPSPKKPRATRAAAPPGRRR